jgi:hypothetical protein
MPREEDIENNSKKLNTSGLIVLTSLIDKYDIDNMSYLKKKFNLNINLLSNKEKKIWAVYVELVKYSTSKN